MIQRLLFFLFIFLSFSVYSQIQGPPPPLGIFDYYKCDPEGDEVEEFDLVNHFLFPFNISGEEVSNYHPLTFYLTEDDRNNEVNPIINSSNYVNVTNPQKIYFRTYAINPGAYVYLDGGELIHASQIPTPNLKNTLILCDDNGLNTFNLSKSSEEILAGLSSNIYTLSYYETLIDAENEVNKIATVTSYTNSTNPQKIYVRVFNRFDETCYSIVELDLKAQGVCQDLEVLLLPLLPPRPGFISEYHLYVSNRRDDSKISGRIQFNHESFLELMSVLDVGVGETITNISNGFFLDIDDLGPQNSTYVSINIKTPISVPLETVLISEARYLGTDYNLSNNYSKLTQTVVGSYDPNDIQESHGPDILYNDFSNDDYLYYRVRFQNVGTADAINVSIDNTLDARLDESTIVMLNSSHTNVFTRVNDQLNWKFDDIHLPSEDMDEPNSHGYVYYKIKPLAGYKVGDIIPNTAEIYFDFNPAVITNTFNTEFIATLNNKKFNEARFSIFPNPAKEIVKLRFNKNINDRINVSVYSIQGKLMLNSKRALQNSATQINVSSLKRGMYFLKVNGGVNGVTQKLIIE